MIKSENGNITVEGTKSALIEDAIGIMSAMYTLFSEDHEPKRAKALLGRIVEDAIDYIDRKEFSVEKHTKTPVAEVDGSVN